MDKQASSLSVVIPVHNEVENLSLLHQRISAVMRNMSLEYEVVYVDDGSTDGSFALLQRLAAADCAVRVVRLSRNFGQTAALAAGVAHSQGEVLALLDADLQNDPADIPRLLTKLEEGYDLVSGWRRKRRGDAWLRCLLSRLANAMIARAIGVPLHDLGCTLKVYRRSVFAHVPLYGETHRFIAAYAALAGARIAEVEVVHHPRHTGRSHYGLGRTLSVLLDLLLLKFYDSFATRPQHLVGLPGLLALALGIFFLPVALLMTCLHTGRSRRCHWSGPLLWGAGCCCSFGLLSLQIGILAEMLMRTYHESQGKQPYIVRCTVSGRESCQCW
ncbi:glycosyltransferase family 2 protein [Thermogemmatispora sp.]|uniref:glycosyltransferase family 2 protein n=1 Tax=Thermogemmatispora sp. TaxID=1968838 RepID=UPI001D5DCF2F|nr:glycosyltransferase family 2 protein [Thermogemmatispora sp.]MBX5449902.1 glycosyltransferase family 2 protein [Thermogemmatispora sp.]